MLYWHGASSSFYAPQEERDKTMPANLMNFLSGYVKKKMPGAAAGAAATGAATGAATVAGGAIGNPPKTDTGVSHSGSSTMGYGELFGNAEDLYGRLDKQLNTDFKFDPSTDASYIAAQQLADEGAKDASRMTLETMNDRGIVNSSITSSQLGQIEQKAKLEPLKLIPQLQAQALQKRQGDMGIMANLFSNVMNTGQQRYQFDQTMPMQQAAVTGRYLPEEAKGLVDTIMNAKVNWPKAGTKEEKAQWATKAKDARDQLTAMGYDAEKMFGGNVGLAEAGKNFGGMGQLTPDAQAAMLNALNNMPGFFGTFPKGAGDLLKGLPMFSGLSDIYKGMEGKPTMDLVKFNAEMKNLGLEAQGKKLSQAATAQNMNYSTWLHNKNISEHDAELNTNDYLGELTALVGKGLSEGKPYDREEMYKKVAKDHQLILDKGIKIANIWDAINNASFEPNKWQDPNAGVQNGPNYLPE